jgi:ABC-type phosphate transport system substrate-binding protein
MVVTRTQSGFLGEVSPDWKSNVGVDTTVQWPTGVGAKGNDGVTENVATSKGAIGYVEYAYAKQNKLTYASMVNKAGKVVEPTLEAFQAAAANADWDHAPDFYLILANQPGDKSWPMTAATFILMYKNPPDVAASNDALAFSNGLMTRAAKGLQTSTTSRCLTMWWRSSRRCGPKKSSNNNRRMETGRAAIGPPRAGLVT